jgi:hypothetical protein
MSLSLLAIYCILALTLTRAVLDKSQSQPTVASCDRCGLPRERRALGEAICGCSHG